MPITKYIIYAVLIGFFAMSFLQPARAQAGVGSIASGLGLLPIASKGIVSLFQPFWEIKNLIQGYGNLFTGSSPALSNQAIEKTDSEKMIKSSHTVIPFTPTVGGSNVKQSSISWSSGKTASVPLSSAARSYYSSIGAKVS
jgi:hypothetical protein